MRCAIVPPYLLLRIAGLDDPRLADAADAARRSLIHDTPFRDVRHEFSVLGSPAATTWRSSRATRSDLPQRTVFDARNTQTLPGRRVRAEGDEATADVAVTEAYDGLGATHELLSSAYSRASIDDENLPLQATVHYGDRYDNAFWNGSQMVFGDGDGQIFTRFTASLSVIGHELAHGLTQFSANLRYQGQSGALNESVSDVFGCLVEQHANQQTADAASWLIGRGLFTDQVEGTALRSLSAPGTAYDDDVLGKDPQPATMDGFVDTPDDNGGVHLNSGIPNHAFYLTASELGGYAWQRAGQIWYDALTGGRLPADSTFSQFAQETGRVAAERFGAGSREQRAVEDAWHQVGVSR